MRDFNRIYIREGSVKVFDKEKKYKEYKEFHLFLFNDILVQTIFQAKNQFKFKKLYKLQYASFTFDSSKLITLSSDDFDQQLVFTAVEEKEKDGWIRDLFKTLNDMENTRGYSSSLLFFSSSLLFILIFIYLFRSL